MTDANALIDADVSMELTHLMVLQQLIEQLNKRFEAKPAYFKEEDTPEVLVVADPDPGRKNQGFLRYPRVSTVRCPWDPTLIILYGMGHPSGAYPIDSCEGDLLMMVMPSHVFMDPARCRKQMEEKAIGFRQSTLFAGRGGVIGSLQDARFAKMCPYFASEVFRLIRSTTIRSATFRTDVAFSDAGPMPEQVAAFRPELSQQLANKFAEWCTLTPNPQWEKFLNPR